MMGGKVADGGVESTEARNPSSLGPDGLPPNINHPPRRKSGDPACLCLSIQIHPVSTPLSPSIHSTYIHACHYYCLLEFFFAYVPHIFFPFLCLDFENQKETFIVCGSHIVNLMPCHKYFAIIYWNEMNAAACMPAIGIGISFAGEKRKY